MKKSKMLIAMLMSILLFFSFACSDSSTNPVVGEGPEGTGGEAGNESGMSWNVSETANEIVNGIRLILSYNSVNKSFEGTLENLNTTMSPQVRVEVHVYDATGNSTEFGPTTPADMNPGEKRNIVLPTPGAGNIATFKMHPEVGSGGGEGSGS